jgi:hypothetical protein
MASKVRLNLIYPEMDEQYKKHLAFLEHYDSPESKVKKVDNVLAPQGKPFITAERLLFDLWKFWDEVSLDNIMNIPITYYEHVFGLFETAPFNIEGKTVYLPYYNSLISSPIPFDKLAQHEKNFLTRSLDLLEQGFEQSVFLFTFFLDREKLDSFYSKLQEIFTKHQDVLYLEGYGNKNIHILVFYKVMLTYSALMIGTDVMKRLGGFMLVEAPLSTEKFSEKNITKQGIC